jgi:hypothetical protein
LEGVWEEGSALLEGCKAVGWPAEERTEGAWSCHGGRIAAAQWWWTKGEREKKTGITSKTWFYGDAEGTRKPTNMNIIVKLHDPDWMGRAVIPGTELGLTG